MTNGIINCVGGSSNIIPVVGITFMSSPASSFFAMTMITLGATAVQAQEENILHHEEEEEEWDMQVLPRALNRQRRQKGNSDYSSQSSSGNEAFIVCGLDGTVYTLDAWTGQLRGLFASGGSLVDSSSPSNDATTDGSMRFADREAGREEDTEFLKKGESVDKENQNCHDNASIFNKKEGHKETEQECPLGEQERIIPGLDGNLYSLTEFHRDSHPNFRLDMLPIKIQDVIDTPFSTCRLRPPPSPNTPHTSFFPGFDAETDGMKNEEDTEDCGVVMGHQTTKIFAIDPSSGTFQWMQSPNSGFTTAQTTMHHSQSKNHHQQGSSSSRRKSKGVKTVLLKRQDYSVRYVDRISGEEFWKVGMGEFSAMDVGDGTTTEMRSSLSLSKKNYRLDRAKPGMPKQSIQGRASRIKNTSIRPEQDEWQKQPRTRAATAAKTITNDADYKRKENKEHQKTSSDPFFSQPSLPLIRKDGYSLEAIDAETGKLLWRRRIESFITSVYGVDRENRWVSPDLLDADIMTSNDGGRDEDYKPMESANSLFLPKKTGHTLTTLPLAYTPSPSSFLTSHKDDHVFSSPDDPTLDITKSLSSFYQESQAFSNRDNMGCRNEICRKMNTAKIGKHFSTFFVASTLQIPPGRKDEKNPSLPVPSDINFANKDDEIDYVFTEDNKRQLKQFAEFYKQMNTLKMSHKTRHGLFLSWSMVSLLVGCVITGFFLSRFLYRKRKDWLKDDAIVLPNNIEVEGMEKEGHTSLAVNILSTPTVVSLGQSSQTTEITQNKTLNHTTVNDTSKTKFSVHSPPIRSMSLPQLNNHSKSGGDDSSRYHKPDELTEISLPSLNRVSTAVIKVLPAKKSIETNTISQNSEKQQSLPIEAVSHVGGFPLVQYSRYSLEFQEISSLGKGGFGTVFKCSNTLDGREYAIKKVMINSLIDSNGQMSKQFSLKLNRVLREVKILALLDHPNIVRYYTAWLEVDNQDEVRDESSTISGASNARNIASGFSSDLLAGFDPSYISSQRTTSKSYTTGGRRSQHLSAHNNVGALKENPYKLYNCLSDSSVESTEETSLDRRRCFQKSFSSFCGSSASTASEDDLGFNWDRSSSPSDSRNKKTIGRGKTDSLSTIHDGSASDSNETRSDDEAFSNLSIVDKQNEAKDGKLRSNRIDERKKFLNYSAKEADVSTKKPENDVNQNVGKNRKHILYIQMQLSKKTLLDYFEARKKYGKEIVDIPSSLRIFFNIARGLKHVHEKGLIHRDLKPSNCFMGDSEEVKIGDFGLSRKSSSARKEASCDDESSEQKDDDSAVDQEITTQVGTSSYASPEQMDGSYYDSSTDVFSLGIILFELCYPMYTRMERFKVLEGIRKRVFPLAWKATVAKQFSSINEILTSMLSRVPQERPSAADVANHIESLLGEYTVLSLDHTTTREGSFFLRVEAEDTDGVLARTIKLIKEAASHVKIIQYSLRGQESKAIMEFALAKSEANGDGEEPEEWKYASNNVSAICEVLLESSEIKLVRKVNEQSTLRGASETNTIVNGL